MPRQGPPMGYVIAGQTISLDGYVADANGSAEPLYPDLADLQGSEYMNGLIEETGAVVMGRRSFEMPDELRLFLRRDQAGLMGKTFGQILRITKEIVLECQGATGGFRFERRHLA